MRTFAQDSNAVVRNAALRLLEPWVARDPKLQAAVAKQVQLRLPKATSKELLQFVLSSTALPRSEKFDVMQFALTKRDTPVALLQDAVLSGLTGDELAFTQELVRQPAWQEGDAFRSTFMEMLASAVLNRRDRAEIESLLTTIEQSQKQKSYLSEAMLTGVVIRGRGKWQPVALSQRPGLMRSALRGDQLQTMERMFEWPGHRVDAEVLAKGSKLDEGQQKLFVAGRQQFLAVCAGCHGTDGAGVKRLGPPLAGSEWVTGDPRRLALIVLHGIEGPMEVAGKRYETPEILPTMPSHSTMDDEAITAILTYIRNEWGNDAGAPERRLVGKLRHTTQGRVQPWNVKELDGHVATLDTTK